MRKLVLSVVVAAALAAPGMGHAEDEGWDDGGARDAAARVDPAKAADIRKLMELTGSGALAKQMMAQMLPSLKKLVPEAPESFWKDFLDQVDEDDLVDMVVPIYDRHLSHDDIKAILAFYRSPSGQHLIRALPAIMSESMAAGQQWGEELGRLVVRRARERHLLRDAAGSDAE